MAGASDLPEMVRAYLDAYNRKDVAGMLSCLTDDMTFEHVSNGAEPVRVEGKPAFAALARHSAEAFRERHQAVREVVVGADSVAIAVDYRAVVAADLPNGLKAGQRLALQGTSFFTIRDGRIARIVDFS